MSYWEPIFYKTFPVCIHVLGQESWFWLVVRALVDFFCLFCTLSHFTFQYSVVIWNCKTQALYKHTAVQCLTFYSVKAWLCFFVFIRSGVSHFWPQKCLCSSTGNSYSTVPLFLQLLEPLNPLSNRHLNWSWIWHLLNSRIIQFSSCLWDETQGLEEGDKVATHYTLHYIVFYFLWRLSCQKVINRIHILLTDKLGQ